MKLKRFTLGAGLAAALLMVVAPAAYAANVLTIDDDSSVGTVKMTGTNVGDIEFMTDWEVPTWCHDSETEVEVYRGITVEEGAHVATIGSLEFSDCWATELTNSASPTGMGMPVEINSDFVKFPSPYTAPEHDTIPNEWTQNWTDGWKIIALETPTSKNQKTLRVEVRNVTAQMNSINGGSFCALTASATAVEGLLVEEDNNGDPEQFLIIDTPSSGNQYPLALQPYAAGTDPKVPTSSTCGNQILDIDSASMYGKFQVPHIIGLS